MQTFTIVMAAFIILEMAMLIALNFRTSDMISTNDLTHFLGQVQRIINESHQRIDEMRKDIDSIKDVVYSRN